MISSVKAAPVKGSKKGVKGSKKGPTKYENLKSNPKVLIFGWSDTSPSNIDKALQDCGIPQSKRQRSKEEDKGLGIAVVTAKQANCYKDFADSKEKLIFANIHEALSGITSLSDLSVEYKTTGGENGEIKVGGSDYIYDGIVTDDPSYVVSGRAKGLSKGDDGMWSTENGQEAYVKMKDNGGRQYVKMSIRGKKKKVVRKKNKRKS
jgi:hypothetical protein